VIFERKHTITISKEQRVLWSEYCISKKQGFKEVSRRAKKLISLQKVKYIYNFRKLPSHGTLLRELGSRK
jgi:hypothetical protein